MEQVEVEVEEAQEVRRVEVSRNTKRKWEELEKPLKKKVNQGIADAALLAEYGRHYWGR